MARQGIDATSIQEITDRADVGFGSFYNHFRSKDAIAAAVMEEAVESFGTAMDRLAEAIDDPAEVIAASVRHGVERADSEAAWGWFLIRTAFLGPSSLDGTLGRRMVRDVERGVASGRFAIDDPPATMMAAGGAVLALMAARLRGEIDEDVPERAAGVVLRLLGLSEQDAHEVSRRPLPPVPRLQTSTD